ncbi:MAG: hypothetical protein H7A05_09870 [Pseudomonadales bacterium]|nr:hypothetical protein [Pseudomonadales bacterium]MCP5331232.1 hypothetical protein [Pseudomonadales bacterium]MCP5344917.1 hypothetical protein [Pseudomonadales bacterium]
MTSYPEPVSARMEEAFVWHDGEARAARDRYAALSAEDRAALQAFLQSL